MVGRPAKHAKIVNIRELSLKEVVEGKRGRVPAVQRFRDSHHRMAQLFACGLRPHEVAQIMGYSLSRVSVLRSTPAFDDLIDQKRGINEAPLKEPMQVYNQLILENGIKAERKLADKLDDDDETEEMSVRELINISRDAADRVGLSKRSVQMNVSTDFASLLDRAIARSREALPRSGDLVLVSQLPDRGSLVETQTTMPQAVEAQASRPIVKFKRRM